MHGLDLILGDFDGIIISSFYFERSSDLDVLMNPTSMSLFLLCQLLLCHLRLRLSLSNWSVVYTLPHILHSDLDIGERHTEERRIWPHGRGLTAHDSVLHLDHQDLTVGCTDWFLCIFWR